MTVQERHRPRFDPTAEAIAHHELITVAQTCEERAEVGEVVRVVGVAHHDIPAVGSVDPTEQGRPVATLRDIDDDCARITCELLRSVGRPVVGHDHLSEDAGALEPSTRLVDARRHGFRLVQARHDHRHLARVIGR